MSSNKIHNELESGWSNRCVDFKKIHGNENNAFSALVSDMNLKEGMEIADIMCGYGSVSKEVLENCRKKGISLRLHLLDAYEKQINGSENYLANYTTNGCSINRIIGDAKNLPIKEKSLDKVIIKMGLHEVQKNNQMRILSNSFRSLREGGQLYVWDIMGKDEEINKYFNMIAKKKDELAGYTSLVKNRHFSSNKEIVELMKSVGIRNITNLYTDDFHFDTKKFLEVDFSNDNNKLTEFNEYIRNLLPSHIKKEISYREEGDNIGMIFERRIIRAERPIL